MKESLRPYSDREMDESALVKETLRFSVPLETAEQLQDRKARMLPSIKNRIANVPASREKRRRERGMGKLLAAAALLFILGGSWASVDLWLKHKQSGKGADVASLHDSRSRHDARSVDVQLLDRVSDEERRVDSRRPGDSLSTSERQTANLEFPDGTSMRLDGESALEFVTVEPGVQEVRLNSGRVSVNVPHEVQRKRRVAVVTPHGRAIVKGTKFTVEVRGTGDSSYSKVSVERGIVEVQHRRGNETLHKGDSWVSSSTDESRLSPGDGTLEFAPPNNPRDSVAGGTLSHRPSRPLVTQEIPPKRADSDLAEQNRMIERALTAENAGDLKEARRILSLFTSRYPDSPLLESVQVALKRVRSAEKNRTNIEDLKKIADSPEN